jgi:hypothetical protein
LGIVDILRKVLNNWIIEISRRVVFRLEQRSLSRVLYFLPLCYNLSLTLFQPPHDLF